MAGREQIKARREYIIEILSDGATVLTDEIMRRLEEKFGKAPGLTMFRDDIKKLRGEGYVIEGSNDGLRLIRNDDDTFEAPGDATFEQINKETINEWLLMFLMSSDSERIMSFKEISEGFSNHIVSVPEKEIMRLLTRLTDRGNVIKQSDRSLISDHYKLSESVIMPVFTDEGAAVDFSCFYGDIGFGEELGSIYKDINDKIARVVPDIDTSISETFKAGGRSNNIPSTLLKQLDAFLGLSYTDHAIDLIYKEKEKDKALTVCTAMVIFCVDKNMFYILGEVSGRPELLRLDRISEARVNVNMPNTIYDSTKYKDLFRQMWSASVDEPTDIKIAFAGTPEMKEYVEALVRARLATAAYFYQKSDTTNGHIIYHDKIRGLNNFISEIRGLGEQAVIIKPENLRRRMIEKTKETLKAYEELS